MNELGLKEKAIAAIVATALLYALAVVLWFISFEGSWRSAAKKYDREKARYERERALIGERTKWDDAYEEEKNAMPTFAFGQATDTTWLRKVEEIARTNRVLITQIDAGQEVEADDVLELPIEVKAWEGSLEALVKFMYALEQAKDGMFDIREMSVQPNKAKPGYLKGSLSLTCAYMREDK